MTIRLLIILLLTTTLVSAQVNQKPVRTSIETQKRSIRTDVPMTNSIRNAFKAGTRDFSGKPGPKYWQLEADYTIQASLDPATQTITGSEKIVMHNNSPDDLKNIVLRLDHNIFRPEAMRGGSTPAEATEGMVITSLKVAGQAADLTATPSMGRNSPPPTKIVVFGLTRTIASINLLEPVKAGSSVELEIEWRTKLPGGPNGRGHRKIGRAHV